MPALPDEVGRASTLAEPAAAYRASALVRRALLALAAVIALAMVALGTLSLLDLAARHTTEERATYTDVRALVVDDASDIRLTSARAGAPLQVVARVTEGLASPERRARRRADGTLRLSASCPGFPGGQCNVRYEVRVPTGTLVRADASVGDIVAENLRTSAPLDLSSSAGDVTAIGVSTPALRLSSTGGDVRARGVGSDRVWVRSSAGDVAVSLLAPAARLEARSSGGDVDVLVPDAVYRVEADTTAGDVDTADVRTSPDSPRRIIAGSSAGDIRVAVRR